MRSGYDPGVSEQPTRRATPWARLAGVAALGILGGLLALALAPPPHRAAGPGELSLRAVPSRAGTSALALPPFGEVTASTHRVPMRFEVRIDRIDLTALEHTLSSADPEATLRDDVESAIVPLLRAAALRSIVVATLGGLVAVALLPRRAPHRFLVGGGSAALVVTTLLVGSWATYDATAFRNVRFVGPLERAPALLQAAQRDVGDLSQVRDRVQVLSRQVSRMYAAVESKPVTGTTAILHVSDIHSNPLGVEVVQQLATAFDVDAVLDTGDLTSFGNPLESRITSLVDDIEVPYLFVPGNHDATATRMRIAATPGVKLLDGTIARVHGVRILGVADPTFTATNETSTKQGNEARIADAPRVAQLVRTTRPDVLAVHDERHASDCYGEVPVIVSGHLHRRRDRTIDGTRALVVGSTGATGLGAFTVDTGRPYEAEVLRFDGSDLVAIDYVRLDGVTGEFSVQRRLVTQHPEVPSLTRPGLS